MNITCLECPYYKVCGTQVSNAHLKRVGMCQIYNNKKNKKNSQSNNTNADTIL